MQARSDRVRRVLPVGNVRQRDETVGVHGEYGHPRVGCLIDERPRDTREDEGRVVVYDHAGGGTRELDRHRGAISGALTTQVKSIGYSALRQFRTYITSAFQDECMDASVGFRVPATESLVDQQRQVEPIRPANRLVQRGVL